MSIVRLARVLVVAPALACGLVGCSGSDRNDPDAWYNKTVVENFAGRPKPPPDSRAQPPLVSDMTAMPGSAAPVGAVPGSAAPVGAVPPTELYRSESSCGAMLPGSGGSAGALPPAPGDIALEMTECDIARRYGPPDKVELAAMPNGARALTLSYLHSARPRIYHFASGRLFSIENLPEPPPPPPARAKPSKPSPPAWPTRN